MPIEGAKSDGPKRGRRRFRSRVKLEQRIRELLWWTTEAVREDARAGRTGKWLRTTGTPHSRAMWLDEAAKDAERAEDLKEMRRVASEIREELTAIDE